MPGCTHSREFRLEIVDHVENGQKTTAQPRRGHHLSRSMIHRWRKKGQACGDTAFTD